MFSTSYRLLFSMYGKGQFEHLKSISRQVSSMRPSWKCIQAVIFSHESTALSNWRGKYRNLKNCKQNSHFNNKSADTSGVNLACCAQIMLKRLHISIHMYGAKQVSGAAKSSCHDFTEWWLALGRWDFIDSSHHGVFQILPIIVLELTCGWTIPLMHLKHKFYAELKH